MSGEGATPNKELPKRKSEFQYVIEAMKEQWGSMLAMAAMFVGTIALGMLLQPFYNQSDELRAFGKDGASQGRWILLELMMIFAFTALIIWLAKKKKEWIIKVGILGILWLALVYSAVPLAHLILAPDMSPDPFVMEDVAVGGNESVGDEFVSHLGATGYMMYGVEPLLDDDGDQVLNDNEIPVSTHYIEVTTDEKDWRWEETLNTSEYYLRVTEQSDGFVISSGENMWILDRDGNEVESDVCLRATLPAACSLTFNHTIGEVNHTYSITNEPRLIRYHPNKDVGANYPPAVYDAQWRLPEGMNLGSGQLMALKVKDGRMLVVGHSYASLFIIPEDRPPLSDRGGPTEYVEEIWNYSVDGVTNLTAAEWGISPWADDNLSSQSGNEMMLLLGTEDGDVMSWNFDIANDKVTKETRMHLAGNDALDGPIHAIRLGDYGAGGWNELFVAGGGTLHMFQGSSLTDYMHIDYDGSLEAIHILATEEGAVVSWYSEGNWSGGHLNNEMLIQSGVQLDPLSSWVGLIISTVLMVWLIWRPEWYVVNTTGVLVGSGVVVMLGIAFVPWLVIIFMILAAIYDHWAVHTSKHMLDLADTMIGLNLPILLVAPQEKGFSMLDDGGDDEEEDEVEDTDESSEESKSEQQEPTPAASKKDGFKAKAIAAETARSSGQQPVKKPKKGGAEAMFMGLGDIIFPGMLVISAMTYLAPVGGESAALWVAIGVIIGGLIGYMILMTRVALGIPQAGLPLLNGGSILGYIIFGLAFIGWKALEFNITL